MNKFQWSISVNYLIFKALSFKSSSLMGNGVDGLIKSLKVAFGFFKQVGIHQLKQKWMNQFNTTNIKPPLAIDVFTHTSYSTNRIRNSGYYTISQVCYL